MSPTPHLLTLLNWADRLSAGERCADWEQWLESSPAAGEQWRLVLAAHDRLAAGEASTEDSPSPAELVAALAEGSLAPEQRESIEADCLRSPALLDEVASTVQFEDEAGELLAMGAPLELRLLALVPAAARKNGHQAKPPLAIPVAIPLPPEPPTPIIRPSTVPNRRKSTDSRRVWQVAAAAGLLAVGLCAAVLWLATRNLPQPKSPAVVKGGSVSGDSVPGEAPREPNRSPQQNPPQREAVPPSNLPPPPAPDLPPIEQPAPMPSDPPPAPRTVPAPAPRLGPPPELAIHSARGLLLVNSGDSGAWRVGQGKLAAPGEVRIASLPESWTAVEIPRFGTSIWSGSAAATVAARDEQTLAIRLEHGRFALQGLPPGVDVQIETPGGQWTARAVQDYSTLAVVADELSPALFVPVGAVAVGDAKVGQNQIIRWQNGVPQPPGPLAGAAAVNAVAGAPAVDSLDPAWLAPPTPAEQKEWQTTFGKLAERLSDSDNVATELDRLLTPTMHAKQAALFAQWRIALIDDAAEQARATWELLADRREMVRAAAVRYLIELQPHDQRAVNLARFARRELGPDVAPRLNAWLNTARQGRPATAAEAHELSEYLGNSEMVVRQVAVSLLLHHTKSAFQRARRTPPDFEADAPASRRAAAQQEWRQAIRQIFTRANAPAAARPAVP
jgi:hypothetical protein